MLPHEGLAFLSSSALATAAVVAALFMLRQGKAGESPVRDGLADEPSGAGAVELRRRAPPGFGWKNPR